MEPIVLYCKSYKGDVLRAKRLASSITRFNKDRIPFYISAPEADLQLFKEQMNGLEVNIITDEEIILSNPKHDLKQINQMTGTLSQQIVKSEFWRLGLSENYVCIDSDNEFIRDFFKSDFLTPDETPYTVISEEKEFFEFCDRYHLKNVPINFKRDSALVQELFERDGRMYSFGIPPLIWSRKVWISLEENLLNPRNLSLADLITKYPFELRIYGEALLKYRPIPLWPCSDIFKTYHYNSQHFYDKKRGITIDMISKNYLGVVKQSNWEGEHFGTSKKSLPSRINKKIKKFMRWLSV